MDGSVGRRWKKPQSTVRPDADAARSSNRSSPRVRGVYGQASEADVNHLRTWGGELEADLVVVRGDQARSPSRSS